MANLKVYTRGREPLGHVQITEEQVRRSIARYDREHPLNDYPRTADRPDVKTWWQDKRYKFAVRHKGRCYPPKPILRLAIGTRLEEGYRFFGGGSPGRANWVFERLGFEVVLKSECRRDVPVEPPPKHRVNHVFLSYAREDQTYARALADHLGQRGFDVWMDDRIDFGDRWWRTIVRALRASAAFVVVMTPESEKSEWVEREVMLALEERKPVFPLLLRGKRFPILINIQYALVTGERMPPDNFCSRLRRVVPAQEKP